MKSFIVIDVNGRECQCDYQEKGYYLGSMEIAGIHFHVEMIEITGSWTNRVARNRLYQGRIDQWVEKNDGESPQIVELDGVRYFVHVEVYAA